MVLAALLRARLAKDEEVPERVDLAALLNKEWAQSSSPTSGITAYGTKSKRRTRLKSRSKP